MEILRTAAVLAVAVLAGGCGGGGGDEPPQGGRTPAVTEEPTGTGSAAPGEPTSPAAQPQAAAAALPRELQPLWPFTGVADVRAWQNAYRTGGHASWHLDVEATALGFARDHLGFAGIDRVTSRKVSGGDARIGVGYDAEGSDSTAAVLHLVRFGTGADAPWEVVGTDDDTLTLTTPAYGARAKSPLKVGGRITGVDESLRVSVHRVGAAKAVGTHCCVPAGGTRAAWSSPVSFKGSGGVLTIVVSTGGHIADVERFAVTAVRP